MNGMTVWEPVSDIANLSQRMDRLFDQLMGRQLRRGASEGSVRGAWMPAVDILEKNDAIEITADLPGFQGDDVDVSVEGGVLTIRGERKFEDASEGETYHRVERTYGLFERTFTLPNTVDPSKVEARFKDGVMHVRLPKREELKPRSIKVKVEKA
jgi:HSP20 family protein